MNSIESKLYSKSDFGFKIFKKANASGSANISGTDEISFSYLIAISEFDEHPEQSLFEVEGFINPKILDVKPKSEDFTVSIEHGMLTNRKTVVISVSLHKVELSMY
jgi:hypothetical protein